VFRPNPTLSLAVHRRKKPIADLLQGSFFNAAIDGEFNPSEFQVVKLLGSGKSSKVFYLAGQSLHCDRWSRMCRCHAPVRGLSLCPLAGGARASPSPESGRC